ncbi:uncharacterized protein ARMOST_08174 [Armillaria ostoyae]|uniref:DUF6535 domain-containing protein n=1 Tax=Armillaria ostoyae TaxID=47428 RepID=A0A284R7Z3_ARMOS|nr:uncharacterized protein ARMOST_08174 [Armillaria ostoyae]
MSIHEIDRTSPLDPGPDESIRREVAETEEPGIGGDGEHERNPAGQEEEVESGGAKKGELEEEEEDQAPATAAPPTSATAANAKTTFGMKRSNHIVKKGNDSYDYEQKYPEDAPNEEAAPAARVWRTYEDESRNHDANMVEESRDNVDVLLVFAGLFSAVVTTFVVQTSQSLQTDYAAMSASLLYESILIQRAIANGSSVNAIAASPLNPTIAFIPATTDVWVNGLWFTSLFLSLTTALVAVLVKQWLHHYVALPSGTPRDRSFTRQFRYAGFEKWHVQVIIGLLPVLMHLALAIFLSGLVIFLQPLRAALSWVICAGTVLVYTAYVVATILPMLFPQCPYRTPLCDLLYISLRRIAKKISQHVPQSSPCTSKNSTVADNDRVQVRATDVNNLATEALQWLFKVSSNPTVQSIVVQSVGGLPMASEEKFLELWGNSQRIIVELWTSLLDQCLLETKVSDRPFSEPVQGMELKLGRLLRFGHARYGYRRSFIYTPNVYSFDLTAAILSRGGTLRDRETLNDSVTPGAFFMDNVRSSKLLPRSWYNLMRANNYEVLRPLDPNHANMFPLHLCSAILKSFARSLARPIGLTQEFDSPLVLDFEDALPYFIDEIYDVLLFKFFESKDQPSVIEPSSLKSLRVLAVAIKFLLCRLSLPDYEMSHTTIRESLTLVTRRMWQHRFSSQEAIIVMPVVEDIIAHCLVPPLNIDPGQGWGLWRFTMLTYETLTQIAPSACSLHGLQSTVDLMTRHWNQTANNGNPGPSTEACQALTTVLWKRIPVAFTVFREKKCLEFLGNHMFLPDSVYFVHAYIAGVFAMQRGSDVDVATHQPHIDYLHNPDNLFTACSILAIYSIGFWDRDRRAIRRDIMTLAKLRPRDAAWDECRKKLCDLAQNDGAVRDFLGKGSRSCHGIDPKKIQVGKDNITYVVHILDDFLNDGAHTIMGRLYHTLGLRRKPEDKPEQEQQV